MAEVKRAPKLCPDCRAPEAQRVRGTEQTRRVRDRKKPQKLSKKEKYAALLADLVSGARVPRGNREAIIRIEALGRVHGGSHGSYGKEAAGYYEERE